MTLNHRRILLFAVILIFLIFSPIIVLYVMGWRFNFPSRQLQKVGALVVASEPKKVNIYLDDKLIKNKSPLKLNNILPGTYVLKLDQQDYYAWSKPISIVTEQTTKIQTIYLLKKPSPAPIFSAEHQLLEFSPDKKLLTVFLNKKLSIISTANFSIINSINLPDSINKIIWSEDYQKILTLADNGIFYLIDLGKNDFFNLNEDYSLNISNLFWSIDENDIIYANAPDGLYRINIFQKTKNKISDSKNVVFIAKDYLFNQQNDLLEIKDPANEIRNKITLMPGASLTFLPVYNNILPVLDTANNKSFLYNFNDNDFKTFDYQVNHITWNNTGSELLMNNSHEIYSFNYSSGNSELILRTSDLIKKCFWLANDYYIIYSTNKNSLKIIERTKLNRNSYDLATDNITDLILGPDDHTIFATSLESVYKFSF